MRTDVGFDWSMEYPVTLDLGRTDEEDGREWFLAELEVVARIGPAADGWSLEDWWYVGSVFDHSSGSSRVKERRFQGRGTDPLDEAVEIRLKEHLYRMRGRVDEVWSAHLREREQVLELREAG